MFEQWSTWELISIPMLDTYFDPPQKAQIASELRKRGVTGSKLYRMRVFSFGGLLYNVLRGEWLSLDLQDIIHGWSLNAFIATLLVTGPAVNSFAVRHFHFPLLSTIVTAVPCLLLAWGAFRLTRCLLQAKLGLGT